MMKYIILFLSFLFHPFAFASVYDSTNTVENKIEEGRFKYVKHVYLHGNNPDVDAPEDVIENGGNYAGFPSGSAETFQVFSSSAADAAAGTGARTVRLFYLDGNKNCFDANEDFLYEDVTLNGVTGVNTTATGVRIWAAEILTSGSGGTNAGTITIRHTTTTANVFGVIQIGVGRLRNAVFTVCKGYTAYLESADGSMIDTNANRAVVAIIKKLDNGTSLGDVDFGLSTAFAYINEFRDSKFLEKTDLKLRVTSINNINGVMHANFRLRLVKNKKP